MLLLLPTLPARGQSSSYTASLAEAEAAYARFAPSEALKHYEEAHRQAGHPVFAIDLGLARTHYDIGLDLLAEPGAGSAENHFQQAVAAAEGLVAAFPDSARAHALLAATLGNLAQFRGGKERLALAGAVERHSRDALALDSVLVYPYVALGVLYRELSSLTWAEKTWADLFLGDVPAVTLDDALALLQKAARLDPLLPFVHHELAETYLRAGDTERAHRHLKQLAVVKAQTTQDLRNQFNARQLLKQ